MPLNSVGTNFDYPVYVQGVPIVTGGFATQGNIYFVKPYSGNDGNDGKTLDTALKTLSKAYSLATANQNDIIYLLAEHNTASLTTDYQTATLTWAKNMVHLIGVNSGCYLGQRSRVAFASTYATASNLFTLSANGCIIANIEFYAGVASVNPTGCMSVTGLRNRIQNCQISGIGHASMDIAGAYSLSIAAGEENLFKNCYIGLETVSAGATINAHVYMSAGAARNTFEDCFFGLHTAHATNTQFLRIGSAGINYWVWFKRCVFFNASGTGMAASTALTQAMTIHASAGGAVILDQSNVYGAADVNSADTVNVIATGAAPAAATSAIGISLTR
jgi:hypothetical protein